MLAQKPLALGPDDVRHGEVAADDGGGTRDAGLVKVTARGRLSELGMEENLMEAVSDEQR